MNNNPEYGVLQLTANILSAYASHNQLSSEQLPELIQQVYEALTQAHTAPKRSSPEPQEAAVPVKKSVFPEYIICLEDGKKLKMLKRHLSTAYGMTIDEYRAKWSLPRSYPMVAPNYAEKRSVLAKKIGLGRKREDVLVVPTVQKIPEGLSGRKRRRAQAA